MHSRWLRLMISLLVFSLILLCACKGGAGETARFEGFTVKTEKAREKGSAGSEAEVTSRAALSETVEEDFVLNKSSMRFHLPSCSGISDIKEQNRWDYHGTRDSVIDMGYAPCKICNP